MREGKHSKNETQMVIRTVLTFDKLYNLEKRISNDEGNMTLEFGNKYIFAIYT